MSCWMIFLQTAVVWFLTLQFRRMAPTFWRNKFTFMTVWCQNQENSNLYITRGDNRITYNTVRLCLDLCLFSGFKQQPIAVAICMAQYRCANKFLARPGRKQATGMSKSSLMMDRTRSCEMSSCSAIDLAEIRQSSKISSWIWSLISGVGLRTSAPRYNGLSVIRPR